MIDSFLATREATTEKIFILVLYIFSLNIKYACHRTEIKKIIVNNSL